MNHFSRNQISTQRIAEDSIGHSFNSLFGHYLTSEVQAIGVDEPYLIRKDEVLNLLVFTELVVKRCRNLEYFQVATKSYGLNDFWYALKRDLEQRGIELNIVVTATVTVPKIVLSNGFIFEISLGLHFFKAPNPTYSLGMRDYYFRKCKQTDVTIYRQIKTSPCKSSSSNCCE
ncbi:MIT domain-containing protein 1-like [Stomoxys calcitrans]|uniref:MITD1 C-terminal phospholipase D-like domain-containing protein n=1 Tax=Stomoxys calcitrans TaxID=35570 RepID=A0A1I8NVJ5_STOCA|nr:MIT domain-containing protein 1-like [Stomoxys calcitrans]